MKLFPLWLWPVLAGALLSSCAVVPGAARVPANQPLETAHSFYNAPRNPDLNGSHLLGVDKMNPVWWGKNSDNPLPDWWRPEDDYETRKRSWYLRNPMHNFTHYVIGVSDRQFHRTGIDAQGVWNPDGGLNVAVTHAGPLIHLPFISHKGRFLEGYMGWRNGGNFGMALRKAQHPEEEVVEASD